MLEDCQARERFFPSMLLSPLIWFGLAQHFWTKATSKGFVCWVCWEQWWKATQLLGRKGQAQKGPLTLSGNCKDFGIAPIIKVWHEMRPDYKAVNWDAHESPRRGGSKQGLLGWTLLFQEGKRLSSHTHLSVTPRWKHSCSPDHRRITVVCSRPHVACDTS